MLAVKPIIFWIIFSYQNKYKYDVVQEKYKDI